MSKDVKIEIIYFKSDTDVSLEFGLHGNYPVRLLSSSSNDLSTFFNLLKRAVSRSEIIITVGGYSKDEFLPDFIARAINKTPFIPEYNKLGVITQEKYSLPEGAVPLSSSNKRFGGFLIESGPQTIISLSDDRKTRLNIVNNVVVKYIEEHHLFFANGYSPNNTENENIEQQQEIFKTCQNDNNVPTEFEDISSTNITDDEMVVTEIQNLEQNEDVQPSIPIENDTTEPEVIIEDNNFETEQVDIVSQTENGPEIAILDTVSPEDFNFDSEQDTKNTHKKTRPQRRFLRIMCIILSLLIILCTCVTVFVLNRRNSVKTNAGTDYYTELAEIYGSFGDDFEGAFDALQEHNGNINAWINLAGTSLNYPILNTNIVDNYYHNHLPDGSENIKGTVFTSANISNAELEQNIILYGSAEGGIGVFSAIVDLFKSEEITEIPKLSLSNRHGLTEWRIFSLFTENEADGFVFESTDFDTDAKYDAFVRQLIRHNRADHKAVLSNTTSPVITLIAVAGNKRYIACATQFNNVSFIPNDSSQTNDTESNTPDNLVDVNDSNLDLDDKTEDNADKFEQSPLDPDNVVVLPPIIVKPPSGTTSSGSSTTSSNVPSSSEEETSSSSSESTSSNTSSVTSSNTSSNTSTNTSSSTSSEVSSDQSSDTSSDTSSDSSSETNSSDTSSESSSDTSSESSSNTSSETSTDSSDSTSDTSSEASSDNGGENEEQPTVDPLYTWDITLYIKQSSGIVYGSATDIVSRVIEAEMGVAFPLEALKAQAVATYAWLVNNGAMKKSSAPSGVPMKSTPSARAIKAVNEVKGTLITYNDSIANTFYFAYSAGYTANVQDVWTAKLPYLQSVECEVDTKLSNFISTKTYTAEKLAELILKKCEIDVSEMDKSEWIKPIEYDNNNTYCTYVEIGGVKFRGVFVRNTLLSNGIRSTAFTITYDEESDSFTFTCKGWGHGVGMSQEGAKTYANQGWTYEQILAHFYTGTTLIKN